ncbi:hypothetical protein STRAU_6041 [Streptomyces aurantiacus JA 4570]|uniref:Uncharacterized protein n=1 Tax=Streptomyces aurantiacus JA 4570 TaxID=1286094 RepID=S3ZAT0_9ACTN|nr:hypothetical protein STRAU_6041 [Streptomyces aurantiacus JA 4570]
MVRRSARRRDRTPGASPDTGHGRGPTPDAAGGGQ